MLVAAAAQTKAHKDAMRGPYPTLDCCTSKEAEECDATTCSLREWHARRSSLAWSPTSHVYGTTPARAETGGRQFSVSPRQVAWCWGDLGRLREAMRMAQQGQRQMQDDPGMYNICVPDCHGT